MRLSVTDPDGSAYISDSREWWGYGYVYIGETVGSVVHTSLACSRGSKMSETAPRAFHVLREGDYLTIESTATEGTKHHVVPCEQCPDPLDWDWQEDAACYGVYPTVDTFDITSSKQVIDEFCNRCPVVVQCLDWAEQTRAGGGVYGGAWIGAKRQHANITFRKRRAELDR